MLGQGDSCWVRGLALGQGGSRLVRGIRVGSAKLFRYHHVGIGNAKISRWGDYPTQGPKTRGFALRWNIGLS